MIRYTEKGRHADAAGVAAIRNLERRWARSVGKHRMDELRDTLEKLTHAGQPVR